MAQNYQRSHDFYQGNNDVFGAVVQKLRDIKQVVGNPGHELSHLLIVIEGEGELLVMLEDVISHAIFHPRAHQMAPVGNIEITSQLHHKQAYHQNTQLYNGLPGRAALLVNDRAGNVPDNQRHDQSHASPQGGKKQV